MSCLPGSTALFSGGLYCDDTKGVWEYGSVACWRGSVVECGGKEAGRGGGALIEAITWPSFYPRTAVS